MSTLNICLVLWLGIFQGLLKEEREGYQDICRSNLTVTSSNEDAPDEVGEALALWLKDLD